MITLFYILNIEYYKYIIYKIKCSKNRLLVTGSSSNHFHLLLIMIFNVFQYENDICINVWDLGLTTQQLKKLKKMYIILKKNKQDIILHYDIFNYSAYPFFFNIKRNAGEYAWKSTIISIAYNRYKIPLLWLDAGCFIKGSLQNVFKEIHIKTLIYLNTSRKIYNKLMCAGGVVGLYYPSLKVNKLLNEWVSCSMNKECIAPYLSNRSNHRQDQSVFSILLYQNNFNCYNTKQFNFTTHFDRLYRKFNSSMYNKLLYTIN